MRKISSIVISVKTDIDHVLIPREKISRSLNVEYEQNDVVRKGRERFT